MGFGPSLVGNIWMNALGFFWGTSIFVVHLFFFGFQAVFHFLVDLLFFF